MLERDRNNFDRNVIRSELYNSGRNILFYYGPVNSIRMGIFGPGQLETDRSYILF